MRLLDLVVPAAPPECVACGAWAGAAEPLCRACRGRLPWLTADAQPDAVFPPAAYAGPARDLVAALKFRGATRTADAMAAAIVANAPPGWLDDGAALVPVPLHQARGRRRGFNQAERLAAAIALRTGLATRDCLVRTGPRATQMGRSRAERLQALTGSIEKRAEPPRAAILVDDVTTTGATLMACATALSEAGAHEIKAIAYGRTPARCLPPATCTLQPDLGLPHPPPPLPSRAPSQVTRRT